MPEQADVVLASFLADERYGDIVRCAEQFGTDAKWSTESLYTLALAYAELEDTGAAVATVAPLEGKLTRQQKLRLGLILARSGCAAANKLLADSGNLLAQAAVAFAQGDHGRSRKMVPWIVAGRYRADRDLLLSSLATLDGNHARARRMVNRAFRRFGMNGPLDPSDHAPVSLAAFAAAGIKVAGAVSAPSIEVSVVMPARNAQQTIASAVTGVLAQDYHNLELIVVDDASSDETVSIALHAAAGDERLRVVRHDRARGTYAARNTGLAEALGAVVTFNDADDWSHPSRIGNAVRALASGPGLVAIQSRLVRLSRNGTFSSPRLFPLIRANRSSLAFRRLPVLEALGGFDEVPIGADEEFLGRLRSRFSGASVGLSRSLELVASARAGSLTQVPETSVATREGVINRQAYKSAWHARLSVMRQQDKSGPVKHPFRLQYSNAGSELKLNSDYLRVGG